MREKVLRQKSGGYFPGGSFIEPFKTLTVQLFQRSEDTFNVVKPCTNRVQIVHRLFRVAKIHSASQLQIIQYCAAHSLF